jgi:hypothetical protein
MHWIVNDNVGIEYYSAGSYQYQKAGYALRAGARASRIVRIFRMIKFAKIAKLLDFSSMGKEDMSNGSVGRTGTAAKLRSSGKGLSQKDEAPEDVPEKSRVGAAMTDLMNQRYVRY